jgi:hypothetical protein
MVALEAAERWHFPSPLKRLFGTRWKALYKRWKALYKMSWLAWLLCLFGTLAVSYIILRYDVSGRLPRSGSRVNRRNELRAYLREDTQHLIIYCALQVLTIFADLILFVASVLLGMMITIQVASFSGASSIHDSLIYICLVEGGCEYADTQAALVVAGCVILSIIFLARFTFRSIRFSSLLFDL